MRADQRRHKHDKHHKHRKHHAQVYEQYDHRSGYPGRSFVVPARMHGPDAAYYRPFFAGSVYYRPHGHAHAVYTFPVATRDGYVERPFYYCENERFVAPAPSTPPGRGAFRHPLLMR